MLENFDATLRGRSTTIGIKDPAPWEFLLARPAGTIVGCELTVMSHKCGTLLERVHISLEGGDMGATLQERCDYLPNTLPDEFRGYCDERALHD